MDVGRLSWCITPYKRPHAALPENKTFNYYLSWVRSSFHSFQNSSECFEQVDVKSEHAMGYLKGHFSSLWGLCQQIGDAIDHKCAWVTCVRTCIVIHMLISFIEVGDEDNKFMDELVREMHLVMLWDKQMGTDPTHSKRCRAREIALSSRICYLKACMCNLEKHHSSDCAVNNLVNTSDCVVNTCFVGHCLHGMYKSLPFSYYCIAYNATSFSKFSFSKSIIKLLSRFPFSKEK